MKQKSKFCYRIVTKIQYPSNFTLEKEGSAILQCTIQDSHQLRFYKNAIKNTETIMH